MGKQEFAQKYGRNVGGMGVWWENYLGYAFAQNQTVGLSHVHNPPQVDFINPLGLLYQPVKIRFLLGMPVFLYGQQEHKHPTNFEKIP